MAEGFARHLKGDMIEPFSAGTRPLQLDQKAVEVMDEIGIDISRHLPKHVDELQDIPFDLVITLCDEAHEQCPLWLGSARILHKGIEDPARAGLEAKSEDEVINHYRQTRNEIGEFVRALPESLSGLTDPEHRSSRF